MKIIAVLIFLILLGCAPKKPTSYRFQNCKVVEHQDGIASCDCRKARKIGIDARTGAAIIRCE